MLNGSQRRPVVLRHASAGASSRNRFRLLARFPSGALSSNGIALQRELRAERRSRSAFFIAAERTVLPLLASMDDNGDLVERAAREAIAQHGDNAVAVLRECAELAEHRGDELSANAWRDIAEAAERMLRS